MKPLNQPLELQLVVKGEIVQSNLNDFKERVSELLGALNLEPTTDEEFGQAELDVKGLKTAEKACLTAKAEALKQMESVNALFVTLDETSGDVRDARLKLERQIKAKKEEMKKAIEDDAVNDILCDWREDYRATVASAMKGKRTLESLTNAAASAVTIINVRHATNKEIINQAKLTHGAGLVPDERQLMDKNAEDLRGLLAQRVELKKAEDERKRLEDERKKAEAELAEMKRKEAQEAQAKREAEKSITEQVREKFAEPEPEPQPEIPEPVKVGVIPVAASQKASAEVTDTSEADELAEWKREALACFAGLKQAKERLKNETNIERVNRFSDAVNQAWKENL